MSDVWRSAQAGAAMFGLGLALTWWPVAAVAAADTTGHESSSASAGPSKPGGGTARSARTAKPTHAGTKAAKPSASVSGGSSRPSTSPVTSLQIRVASADRATVLTGHAAARPGGKATGSVEAGNAQTPARTDILTPASAAPHTAASGLTALRVPTGNVRVSPVPDKVTGLVNTLGGLVEGTTLLVRRSLFNEAPTVSPVQLSGQTTGAITGTIKATDPEADKITFTVRQAPHYGTVTIDSAGNYTYTPGDGFNGVDAFTVAATDTGPHVNLLNWFRTPSTDAVVSVTQDATNTPRITFNFIYGSGSQLWSSAARAALQSTAIYLSTYFTVTEPVTLTYTVTGEWSYMGSTLASADSDTISSDPGFYSTVVQHKILTGVDANGSAPDGVISCNFGNIWAYGDSVHRGQYDFQSTAMHELLHTFGFLSFVDSPGNNTDLNWTTFDHYIVTSAGTNVIGDNYRWNTAYNANLTGGNGGLYFGGPNAVAVYGGYVPLYTPNPWDDGSSVSHMDDKTFTGANQQLMNAVSASGKGVRKLSPIEIAIMKDLGYRMASDPPNSVLLFVGLVFVRRRKTR
ncbi:Ig-like domain-containing protein [Mycolicibacterium sp. CBM1]